MASIKKFFERRKRKNEDQTDEPQNKTPKEASHYNNIEDWLEANMVGQKEAIKVVSQLVKAKKNTPFMRNKPLTLLFLGTSGVSKRKKS